jgi:hypothetical protein
MGETKVSSTIARYIKNSVTHMCALFWQCQADLLVISNSVSKWGEIGML